MRLRWLLLLACVLLIGCGKPEDKIYGTWKGSFADDPTGGREGASLALASKMLAIEFNKDHTYKLSVGLPFEGTWKLLGTKLYFAQTKAMGMETADAEKMLESMAPKDKKSSIPEGIMQANLDLTLAEDGKTLVGTLSMGGAPIKVNFTKQD